MALIGLMVLTAKLAPVRHQKKEPLLHEAISYGLSAPGGGAVGPMICYIADFVFVKEPAFGARLGNRHCYLARLSPVMAQVIGEWDMANLGEIGEAGIPLDRDIFMRTVLRELTGSLQDIVGMAEASGYISVVGMALGEQINGEYRRALAVKKLNRSQVRDVLIDLKRRINGAFYVIEEREDRIVLGNHACPFGDAVKGRPSLCMMTANVFGHITAQNLGYARVAIDEAIARGDAGCRVVVYLKPDSDPEAAGHDEFFRRDDG